MVINIQFIFFILAAYVNTRGINDIIEFISKQVEAKKKDIDDTLDNSTLKNTTVLKNLTQQGFEYYEQSAQMQKLFGIRLAQYNSYVNSFLKRISVPTEHYNSVSNCLISIQDKEDEKMNICKFIFTKNSTNTTEYACIIAQKDENSKINFMYTQVNTKFIYSEVFVIQNTTKLTNDTVIDSKVKIIREHSNITNNEMEKIMTFFDVIAYSVFENNLSTKQKSLRFLEPITIAAVLTNIDKVVEAWKKIVQTFKTTRSSTIKEYLVGKGFEYFNQQLSVQVINSISEQNLDNYITSLSKRLKVPDERQNDLKIVLEEVRWSDSNIWSTTNSIFSINNGGDTKFFSIMYNKTPEDKYNFIVSDMKVTFKLAPDVMVLSKKFSTLGGLWQDEKEVIVSVPHSLTQDDMNSIMSFFNVVAFKSITSQYNINLDLPK